MTSRRRIATLALVSAQNAKDAADNFVANLRVSEADKGKRFQLVTFLNDEDCRFFYPRRAVNWQVQVNTYISRSLREQYKIRVNRVNLTPADFLASGREDSPEERRKWADEFLRML